MILIAGSMICTTLSPIPRSCWWRGAGCGGTRARTAGVDGEIARYIEAVRGVEGFLAELRADLKARTFQPLPARRRAIPKAGGKVRYLGIATIRDRVAQASLRAACSWSGGSRWFSGQAGVGDSHGYPALATR